VKDAYYFSHDSNARHDPKILEMLTVYGMEGYGWYWVLIEMLRDQEEYKLKVNGKYSSNAYAMQMHTDGSAVKKFIDDCINEFELFDTDGTYFWSESLMERMEHLDDKRLKARKAALKRWENTDEDADAMQTHSERNASKVKESKVKESKVDSNTTPYQKIHDYFNSNRNKMPSIQILSDNRKNTIRLRYKKYGDKLFTLFEKAGKSDFLNGGNKDKWIASFDWLLKETNLVKTLEGNYDNKQKENWRRT
jgi:hypothetical protein